MSAWPAWMFWVWPPLKMACTERDGATAAMATAAARSRGLMPRERSRGQNVALRDDLDVAAERHAREQPAQIVLGGPQATVAHGLADARRVVGAVDRDAISARPALGDVPLACGQRDRAAAVGAAAGEPQRVRDAEAAGRGRRAGRTDADVEPPDDLALVADGDPPL